MRKIFKVLLTILFVGISIIAINRLIINFSDDGLMFIVLAVTFFLLYLFAWIAPKKFFNLCWKITNSLSNNFDYDTGYKKIEQASIGLLITANIILGVGFLIF